MAVVSTAPTKARGNVVLTANTDDDEITLTTCYDKDCTTAKTLTSSVAVSE